MRKAIGWGIQLQKRMVRKIKLERLLRNSVRKNELGGVRIERPQYRR